MHRSPGVFRLPLYCDVHRAHSSYGLQWKVHDSAVSGLVNLALAMRQSGSTDTLKDCVRALFKARLRVYRGAIPPAKSSRQYQYRAEVLECFFGDLGTLSQQSLRHYVILVTFANGDWEKKDSQFRAGRSTRGS